MGKRGPQPKPNELKRLDGDPGKRGMNKDSPVAAGSPSPPIYLSAYALEVWEGIVPTMPPNLYAACDSHILAAYCIAVEQLARASEKLATADDDEIKKWTTIQRQQSQLMATIGTRLGLDSAARSSLNLPTAEKKQSKFGDLIPIKGGRTE